MARDLYAQSTGVLTAINFNTKGDGSGTTVAGSALASDDSLYANLQSVTIAANLTVAALYCNAGPQAGTLGGSFILNTGVVLTAPIIQHDATNLAPLTPLLICQDAGGIFTIVATTITGGTNTSQSAIFANGTGGVTLNITGNLITTAFGSSAHAISVTNPIANATIIGSIDARAGGNGINLPAGASITGTMRLTGDIKGNGGTGVNVVDTGTIVIIGNANASTGNAVKLAAAANVTVTGNAVCTGGTACNLSAGNFNLAGTSNTTTASGYVISGGNLNITGSVTSTGAGVGILQTGGNTNVTGTVQAGTTGNGVSATAGNVTIGGDSIGGSGTAGVGCFFSVAAGGNCNIAGNALGGAGSSALGAHLPLATGNMIIGGNAVGGTAIAGTTCYGVRSGSTGNVTVNGFAVGGNGHFNNVGVISAVATSATIIKGGIKYGPQGQSPTAGEVLFTNAAGGNGTIPPNTLQLGTRVGPYPVRVVGNRTWIGPYPINQFNP